MPSLLFICPFWNSLTEQWNFEMNFRRWTLDIGHSLAKNTAHNPAHLNFLYKKNDMQRLREWNSFLITNEMIGPSFEMIFVHWNIECRWFWIRSKFSGRNILFSVHLIRSVFYSLFLFLFFCSFVSSPQTGKPDLNYIRNGRSVLCRCWRQQQQHLFSIRSQWEFFATTDLINSWIAKSCHFWVLTILLFHSFDIRY